MKPNYEFKLPKLFSHVVPFCISAILLSYISFYYLQEYKIISYLTASVFLFVGLAFLGVYLTVRSFTDVDKRLVDRDLLLDSIPWNGDESVLDIGCGNGILVLSAAKRIPKGKAVGIDLWTENSGDNSKEIFKKNAELEGVVDKVIVETGDARSLTYKSESFEVLLCGLTMHHILHGDGANKAVSEMVRVLKPDGYIAVYDVPIAILSTTKLLQKENIEVTKLNSKMIIGKKQIASNRDPK